MEELGIKVTLGFKLIVSLGNTPSGWNTFPLNCVLGSSIFGVIVVDKSFCSQSKTFAFLLDFVCLMNFYSRFLLFIWKLHQHFCFILNKKTKNGFL